MSQDDSEQNKSEAPSSFKLQKAREKGQVARGMDLGFLTGISAFLVYVWIFGDGLARQIAAAARGALVAAGNVTDGPAVLFEVTGAMMLQAFRPLAFLIGAIFAVVLVFELIQTGVVFTTEPLKIDFKRLNPATNLKRLFTVKILVETGKNVLKLLVYGAITWMVIRGALAVTSRGVTDADSLLRAIKGTGLRLLLFFALAAVVFAGLDQAIVRREFTKQMRMSRREMRRESRDREGEPRMKARRKQLHREFVKVSQSVRGIRGADVLITNPTHYAVALRYDARTMEAPTVVSQGAGQIALRLKRLAFLYGVTIVEDPPLARALYFKAALGREAPEPLYRRIADIYLTLRARSGAARGG